MELTKKKDKRRWKEIVDDYGALSKAAKKQSKNLNEGMSYDQLYHLLSKLSKYFLSQDIENINLQSFAWKVLQLKKKFAPLDEINEEEEGENSDNDELDVPVECEEEEENTDKDELGIPVECEEEEENTDKDEGEDTNEEDATIDINNKESDELDLDKDTFHEIVLESEEEEVDPTTLDEETKKIMYDDFFDEGADVANVKYNDFFGEEAPSEYDDEKEIKSTFEKTLEEEHKLLKEVESENIGEKPWFLTGEVTKSARPEYSVLEEDLDFTTVASQRPVQSDDLNKNIENLVLQRIKSKAFDNVESKVKPIVDPYDYREKFQVDETKSKRSLADVYVEEFMRKRAGKEKDVPAFLLTNYVAPKDESDDNRKMRFKIANLFRTLDALSNKHHIPYLTMQEEKLESKAAALAVEEATPLIASDAMMLAPEEIIARSKRDMKGKTERTVTDRKRERRRKKVYQKQQDQKNDANLNKQLKTPTSKSAQKDASIQFVHKAVKRGHVKVLENNNPKSVKTSNAFFTAIDERQNQVNKPQKKRKLK